LQPEGPKNLWDGCKVKPIRLAGAKRKHSVPCADYIGDKPTLRHPPAIGAILHYPSPHVATPSKSFILLHERNSPNEKSASEDVDILFDCATLFNILGGTNECPGYQGEVAFSNDYVTKIVFFDVVQIIDVYILEIALEEVEARGVASARGVDMSVE